MAKNLVFHPFDFRRPSLLRIMGIPPAARHSKKRFLSKHVSQGNCKTTFVQAERARKRPHTSKKNKQEHKNAHTHADTDRQTHGEGKGCCSHPGRRAANCFVFLAPAHTHTRHHARRPGPRARARDKKFRVPTTAPANLKKNKLSLSTSGG